MVIFYSPGLMPYAYVARSYVVDDFGNEIQLIDEYHGAIRRSLLFVPFEHEDFLVGEH